MSAFEFSFALFGLVLGLALAEILGGFARVLRAGSPRAGKTFAIRIGWLLPALALVVALDLVTAWHAAWQTLGDVGVSLTSLTFGLVETGLYYFAATLLWPDDFAGWPDLDQWFERHRRRIAAALLAANLGFSALSEWLQPGHYADLGTAVIQSTYLAAILLLLVGTRRWQWAAALGAMLSILLLLVTAPLL